MAKNFIEIIGLNEVREDFQNAKRVFQEQGRDFASDWGGRTKKIVQAYIMDAGSVDLGELLQGINYDIDVSINAITSTVKPSEKADKYATFVEHGTKPHRPPVKALQGWADRHGIPVWAVVRKIEREGTEPRWMWRDAYNDVLDRADRDAKTFADRIANRL